MFKGKLVELRAVDRANLDNYLRWFQDGDVLRTLGTALKPYTREQEEAWLERTLKDESGYLFAIHKLDDGMLIGNCGLHEVHWPNRGATFGIVIGEKEYWDKGYGTDATRVMVKYCFDELALHRVELVVYAFNERGIRAYTKAGFREEGRLRDRLWREGRWWDMVVMGILSTDERPDG